MTENKKVNEITVLFVDGEPNVVISCNGRCSDKCLLSDCDFDCSVFMDGTIDFDENGNRDRIRGDL